MLSKSIGDDSLLDAILFGDFDFDVLILIHDLLTVSASSTEWIVSIKYKFGIAI